jgi:cyclic pyranopterin phosphate synthase
MVPAAHTRAAIHDRFPLIACDDDDPSSTARTYRFADGAPGRIGLIAPVSSPFCGACSRLRLTADGKVRPCLFSASEWDLRPLLRDGRASPTDDDLAAFLIDAVWTKQAGHGVSSPTFVQPDRPMSAIGG